MPYFHKSELEKKKERKGNSVGGSGVGGDERGCRESRKGREKESFRGREGGKGGLNKAHIDVPNTAAGVS